MTAPLDTVNDIRSMDAAGRSRSEAARVLRASRNTVAKYPDMEDMSPAAPMPQGRGGPALEGNEEWVAGVLEADLGTPRKQRHAARRTCDRLVAERGYAGSYSTVQRLARAAAGGEGCLELEWAPGTCQVDFGNFRAAAGGRALDLKPLAATPPHLNDRQCVALMSQRSKCLCAGLLEIFRRWGRAPAAMVFDNATEAGRMVRGEVTESRLFSQFRARCRFESRYCNPYSGNEKGSVENAVGFLRRNLLVPVPAFGTLPELNAFLAEGCARVNAAARCRDGRPHGGACREDLAAMRAPPGAGFDAARWVAARGRRVAVLPRAFGRAPRSGTPSRSCLPSSPGRGPSGSRRSGAACRRGSSRGSTGWTPPAGGAPSGRSAGRASPRASRRPARRRSGSSRAAASPTTPRSTCWRDASREAAAGPAGPTRRPATGS